jgi:hypothetical protein
MIGLILHKMLQICVKKISKWTFAFCTFGDKFIRENCRQIIKLGILHQTVVYISCHTLGSQVG